MQQPILFQRLEAATLFFLNIVAYGVLQGNWWLFLPLLFVPDISAIGYFIDSRVGALLYNIGHSAIVPLIIAAIGLLHSDNTLKLIAAIWLAHIGMDRALGFGLKHTTGFADTHLGKIGRKTAA